MSTIIANCPINKKIDLTQTWSREEVNTKRIIKLLIENCGEFENVRNGATIEEFNANCLSEGRAFVSKVFKITTLFSNNSTYSLILKVPHTRTWKDYADRRFTEFPENRFTDEEMDQVAINFHNTECQFYEKFQFDQAKCPTPKVFYAEKIDEHSEGLILMENLADKAEPLGFYASATKEQLYEVAKASAYIQFYSNNEELKKWWEPKEGRMYLDLFMDEFQLTGFPHIKQFSELIEMLDQVRVVFSRKFSYYSLVDKPKEYGATSFCHGDCQPNNILFEKDSNGCLTNKISSIIDWQLIFAGNPLTDLTKFMICSIDHEVCVEAQEKAFDIYYEELEKLYKEAEKPVPFTCEQAHELYLLSIGQQTAAMIILMGFVEKNKAQLGLDEKRCNLFSRRIIDATKRLIPIIKEQKWNDLDDGSVDWRAYM